MKENQRIEFGSFKTLIRRWKDGTFSEILNDWKWIFSYSRRYKGRILLYTLLGIIGTTMGLVSAVAGKYSIDIITGYQMDKLWIVVAIMISSVIANLVITNVTSRISAKLSIDINNDIQADIFDGIMDSDWLAISGYANGDIVNRFSNDVSIVSNNAITWLPTIVIALYNFIATFIVIWHYDKIMSLLAFGTAPFLLLVSKVMIQKQREHGKKVREINSNVMAFEVETFYNYDTIKSFGITDLFGRKIREWQKKQKKITLDYNMFTIKTNIFMTLIGTVVQYIAFGYCLFRLWTHDITYGTMTLFLQQRGNLNGAFNNLIAIIPNFLNSSISAHRILELVQLPREEHIPESSIMDAYQESGFSVTMKDIDFSYVEGKKILKRSSFEANPGEIIALVGPSGEGKTTMIRLILGLIKPDQGAVLLSSRQKAGVDSEAKVEMNADTRHLMAYVPQGNTIFSGTIAENLRMVKESATEEELIEALKSACAWEFVQKLDGNIHYRLGERGKGLSEGQAQRIAIARALLKDAPVLLLDEATSALDVATERQVLKNIIQNHPNKTCIVTTHRPSVLNMCQKVYRVMENKTSELTEEEAGKMAIDF